MRCVTGGLVRVVLGTLFLKFSMKSQHINTKWRRLMRDTRSSNRNFTLNRGSYIDSRLYWTVVGCCLPLTLMTCGTSGGGTRKISMRMELIGSCNIIKRVECIKEITGGSQVSAARTFGVWNGQIRSGARMIEVVAVVYKNRRLSKWFWKRTSRRYDVATWWSGH